MKQSRETQFKAPHINYDFTVHPKQPNENQIAEKSFKNIAGYNQAREFG